MNMPIIDFYSDLYVHVNCFLYVLDVTNSIDPHSDINWQIVGCCVFT